MPPTADHWQVIADLVNAIDTVATVAEEFRDDDDGGHLDRDRVSEIICYLSMIRRTQLEPARDAIAAARGEGVTA